MKKSLVALAALAVVGAASAQSTVTMYGIVDMGIATQKDSFATFDFNKSGVQQGTMSNSRIGFKGTEDLGGGLKANFVLEYAVNPDEKTTTMDNRLGTVGLSGNFGAVTIGRQYTPYHNVQAAMDLLGNLNATPGYIVNAHNFNGGRVSNSVQYATPTFSGFNAVAQVSAGANGTESVINSTTGAESVGKGYGLGAVYAAGPLVAGAAYNLTSNPGTQVTGLTTITGGVADFDANPATPNDANIAGFGVGSKEVKVWAAGASYDFGVAKGSFAYSALTDVKKVGTDVESKGYNFSVAVPFGATTVAANLGRATIKQDGTTTDATITGYQLLASYALSKRTNAYATYGNDKLENAGSELVKRTSTAVGIRHSF